MRCKGRRVPALIFGGLAAIAVGGFAPGMVFAQAAGGMGGMPGGAGSTTGGAGMVRGGTGMNPMPNSPGTTMPQMPTAPGGTALPATGMNPAGPGTGYGSSALPPGTGTGAGSPGNAAGAGTGASDTH